jgi:phage-related protein (TIGR01555 family)
MGWLDTLIGRSTPTPSPAPSTALVAAPRADAAPVDPLWRRAVARLDSVINVLSGLGTSGDKGAAGRPNTNQRPLTDAEVRALYRFNGYARRIVDFPASEATRKGWRVDDGGDDGANPMKDEDKRLQVIARVKRALTLARRDGGACILIVTKDGATKPGALERELNLDKLARVENLIVLDKYEAIPQTWETDPKSPRFGQPVTWHVAPLVPGTAAFAGAGSATVHHSRLIYIDGADVDTDVRNANGGYGDSILQHVWDAIRNKTTIDQAGATASQEMHVDVLKVQDLAGKSVSDQAAFFDLRLKAMAQQKSVLNMIIVGDGEDFTSRAASLTGFADLDAAAKEALAAVSGIPLSILFGEPPGGLSTDNESGRDSWSKVVAALQETYLLEPLTYLYTVLYSAKEGPTGGAVPESWRVEFEPLDEMSAAERATVEKTHAETDQIRIDSGVLTPEHVARSRYSEKGYGYEILPMTEQDITYATAMREAEKELEAEAALANIEATKAKAGAVGAKGAADAPAAGKGAVGKG